MEIFLSLLSKNNVIGGIYQILNIKNGKMYIGSTQNINERMINHFSMLRNNCHHSIYLQRAYNKSLNKSDFQFNILEYCGNDLLIERENYYLNLLCDSVKYIDSMSGNFRKICYNILPYAQKGFSGRHSPETIEKLKYCSPFRKEILVYDFMGTFVEQVFSAPEASKKYNLAKSAILNLCKKKIYVSKKVNYAFGFVDDENFLDFIRSTAKPIKYVPSNKGKRLSKEQRKFMGAPTKVKILFDEIELIFDSQVEAASYLNVNPVNLHRSLKSGKKYKKKYIIHYYEDIV
jgi:group I intron endonuclease